MSSQNPEQRHPAPNTQAPEIPASLLPGRINRSGQGADSIIPHLHEQEEQRKPLSDH